MSGYYKNMKLSELSDSFCDNRIYQLDSLSKKRKYFADDSDDMQLSCLLQMREEAEKVVSWCGARIEQLTPDKSLEEYHNESINDTDGRNNHDIIVEYNHNYITVRTPLTFKIDGKNEWKAGRIFKSRVMIAIEAWERENHESIVLPPNEPFLCLVERRAHSYNPKTMGDNDNRETSNIINMIVRHSKVNDCCVVMDYASVFRLIPLSQMPCMMFYFVPKSYLMANPDFLQQFFLNNNIIA